MRTRLALVILCTVLMPAMAQALPVRDSGWAVGIGTAGRLGGLTVKHPLASRWSAQVFAGSFRAEGYGIDLDLVRHMGRMADQPVGVLDFSLGLGVGYGQYYNSQNRRYVDSPFSVIGELNWRFRDLPQLEWILALRPAIARRLYGDRFDFDPLFAGAVRFWF